MTVDVPEVCLVSCVSAKRRGPCQARDLYASPWFRMARAYAEARGARWWILSAAHGLVPPERELVAYDASLHRLSRASRAEWGRRVSRELARELPPHATVHVLAGSIYREHLRFPPGCTVIVPMRGLGIGAQLGWLKRKGLK